MAGKALNEGLTKEERRNLFGNADLNMLWMCPSDPRFPYWVHVPDSYYEEEDPHYSLMVIIHGTGCAVENYLHCARQWADEHHVALLAPLFPSGAVVRDDFNAYKLLRSDGIQYDRILLAMIEDMTKRYDGIDAEKFFLFGHSGGGQFVNRFLFLHPQRLKACMIGAPGRPTFLNFEEDFFWGVQNFREVFDKELDLEAVREVPVLIAVGELDDKFIGESPYGTNRVARMMSLQRNLLQNGVKTVQLVIIPGIEHADGDQERIDAATAFFEGYL